MNLTLQKSREALSAPGERALPVAWAILFIMMFSYVCALTYFSYDNWAQFHSLMIDYGNIDSAIYNTAQGNFMYSIYRGGNFWVDHFSPIMLLPSVYYLFGDSYLFIFIWQSAVVALAALPLFLISKDILRNQWAALIIAAGYLANGWVQMANWFDYHNMCHEGLFVLSAVYALSKKRFGWYLLFCAALLSVREDSFVMLVGVGLYAALARREYKWAAITGVLAFGYAAITFEIIFPYIRSQHNNYSPGFENYYAWIGQSPSEILSSIFTRPEALLKTLYQRPGLVDNWFKFALAHGFLPFLSLSGLALLIPPSLIFLFNSKWQIYSLHFHYPLRIEAVWMLASVLGVAGIVRLAKKVTTNERLLKSLIFIPAVYILSVNLYLSKDYGIPLLYEMEKKFPDSFREHNLAARELFLLVPKNASVTANQQTMTHFIHHPNAVITHMSIFMKSRREELINKNIDFIVLDTKSQYNRVASGVSVARLLTNSRYGLMAEKDGVYIFKKDFPYGYSAMKFFDNNNGAYTVTAAETHNIVGRKVEKSEEMEKMIIVAQYGKTKPGALAFGPYIDLAQGRYEGAFTLKAENITAGDIAKVDVACEQGKKVIAEKTLAASDFAETGGWLKFHLPFEVDDAVLVDCELRVIYINAATLIYRSKTIKRLGG